MSDINERTDCEVCKQLVKEKHRWDFLWKIACIIFAILAIIFGFLYFGSGEVVTETSYTVEDNIIRNEGDNGTVVIGNEGEIHSGTIHTTDSTPIICISIIAGAVIIVFGGIIIANNHKKDD